MAALARRAEHKQAGEQVGEARPGKDGQQHAGEDPTEREWTTAAQRRHNSVREERIATGDDAETRGEIRIV